MTEQELVANKCLSDTMFFNRYFFKHRFSRKFIVNWHHEIIAEKLQRVLSGECTRLLIRMPPRYGKTELAVKGFIAHGLALNPASKFIHLSYSADLAYDNSEEVRSFVQEEEFQRLFPWVEIDKASSAKKKWYTTAGGGVYATATGGQITGFGAGTVDEEEEDLGYTELQQSIVDEYRRKQEEEQRDLEIAIDEFCSNVGKQFSGAIVIDDPVKPDDADSEVKRERVNERFETTIRSRTNSRNTPIIVIGQAVHERDLIGYLLETEGHKWELLTLPALTYNDDGTKTALWDHKHTVEELEQLERVNSFVFETQYQQNPKPKEGLVYPEDDLNYFHIDDLNQKPDGIVMVADIADEGTDSLAVPVGYMYGDKVYVKDVIFTTQPVEVTEGRVAALIDEHKPDKAVFESNNGGKQFARNVNDLHSHRQKVRWKATTKNKHTRIIMKSGIVKQNFYFRNDEYISEEYRRFMRELKLYPISGKAQHDDAPDAITMLAENTDTSKGWGW